MDKDKLLEFLDRVGARSLEAFLTEQNSDPQEGLSERLDWARSRLADPRYSLSARFLVENETEIRAIMREGEQSWLYRQLMGEKAPDTGGDSVETETEAYGGLSYDSPVEVTPVPEIGAPMYLTPPFGTSLQETTEEAVPPDMEQIDLILRRGSMEPLDTMISATDPFLDDDMDSGTEAEPTQLNQRRVVPIDLLVDPASESGDTAAEDLFRPIEFDAPSALDPATGAVEGDWQDYPMSAAAPSVHDRPLFETRSSAGNLFEDILEDQDTHASFDSATYPSEVEPPSLMPTITPVPSAKHSRDLFPPSDFIDEAPSVDDAGPISNSVTRENYAPPQEDSPLSSQIPPPEAEYVFRQEEAPAAGEEENTYDRIEVKNKHERQRKKSQRGRYDRTFWLAAVSFGTALAIVVLVMMDQMTVSGGTLGQQLAPTETIALMPQPSVVQRSVPAKAIPQIDEDAEPQAQLIVIPTPPTTSAGSAPPTTSAMAFGPSRSPTSEEPPTEIAPSSDNATAETGNATVPQTRVFFDQSEPRSMARNTRTVVLPPAAPPAPDSQRSRRVEAPEPTRTAAVAPRPRAAPRPAPATVSPKPAPTSQIAAPSPSPVPVAKAPSGPISGSWAGTAGSSPLALKLSNGASGRVTASASLTISGAHRMAELSGTFVEKTGAISLTESSGSLIFTGTIDGAIARGTWSAGDGTTERQWFVVRKD